MIKSFIKKIKKHDGYFILSLVILLYFSYALWNYFTMSKEGFKMPDKFEPKLRNINENDAKHKFALRDYYILSSFNSCSTPDSDVSLDALKTVLKNGVRCLDLEVFSFNDETVVGLSHTRNNVNIRSKTKIGIDDVIRMISLYGFSSGHIQNFDDPLIINIRIKSTLQKVQNDIATSIIRHLRSRLAGSSYALNGSYHNIGSEYVTKFKGKVLIFVDKTISGVLHPRMTELTNAITGGNYVKYMSDDDVRLYPSVSELVETNRHNMVITRQNNDSGKLKNFDPIPHFNVGCQMVQMSFSQQDSNLENYMSFFNKDGSAFVLKPEKLRLMPQRAKLPESQNPDLTLAQKVTKNEVIGNIVI